MYCLIFILLFFSKNEDSLSLSFAHLALSLVSFPKDDALFDTKASVQMQTAVRLVAGLERALAESRPFHSGSPPADG